MKAASLASSRERLDNWIASQADSSFPPGGVSYPERFSNVSSYLNNEIHPHVEKGAMLQDGTFLTDHGPRHIETVIERAGDLLADPIDRYPQFTPYEIYLLLMAIHFHDVGNLYGREGHEKNLNKVMDHMGKLVGDETIERNAIKKIAGAHSGQQSGNRDTIIGLLPQGFVLNQVVHYQALAAILRFADELSDDSNRAARSMTALHLIPIESLVFHEYAKALHTVRVESADHVVKLLYCLTREDVKPMGNGDDQAYLIDEIYKRTVKMHYEREYCMRFTRRLVQIDAIDVEISIYESNSSELCMDPIAYRLQQAGYPGDRAETIDKLVSGSSVPPKGSELYSSLFQAGAATT